MYTKSIQDLEHFTEEMTKLRQKSKLNGDSAGDEFYKLILNRSYSYDIMNEEKFSKCFVCNSVTTESKQYSSHFLSARKLNENNYQVKMENSTYGCRTPLTQGFFTLENAKFWYLNFIYNFVYKCLDMSRICFVEGDTDSMYWAVSGCKLEDY
jgi:hypothetical protein